MGTEDVQGEARAATGPGNGGPEGGRAGAPEQGTPESELEARVARLQGTVLGLALALVVVVAWVAFQDRATPSVLAVERLEIIEPDGELSLVLANSQRVPPATIDGRLILANQDEERRGAPAMIFFDGKGDEVGGLTFRNQATEDGFVAVRHFSMDGYKQDQTVVLQHRQGPDGASAGISISDRPWDLSILDAIEVLGLPPSPSRQEFEEVIQALPEDEAQERLQELFGVNRVFLGSNEQDDAILLLRDGRERPRIRIAVSRDGEPSITILDEIGEVMLRLP
jgi:hypothetical protein